MTAAWLPQNVDMSRELFSFDSLASVLAWHPIDDRVMGGTSSSRLRHDPSGHAVFEGMVSLENSGGFASIRSAATDLCAPDATAYLLNVLGDGKRYKVNLRTDDAFDGVNYQTAFVAPPGAWATIRLPISMFTPTLRGQTVTDSAPLDTAKVRQIGLMIADRQAGAFALRVKSISVE